jgi:hypothetical protein
MCRDSAIVDCGKIQFRISLRVWRGRACMVKCLSCGSCSVRYLDVEDCIFEIRMHKRIHHIGAGQRAFVGFETAALGRILWGRKIANIETRILDGIQ